VGASQVEDAAAWGEGAVLAPSPTQSHGTRKDGRAQFQVGNNGEHPVCPRLIPSGLFFRFILVPGLFFSSSTLELY
jgi:hypothetical protein